MILETKKSKGSPWEKWDEMPERVRIEIARDDARESVVTIKGVIFWDYRISGNESYRANKASYTCQPVDRTA